MWIYYLSIDYIELRGLVQCIRRGCRTRQPLIVAKVLTAAVLVRLTSSSHQSYWSNSYVGPMGRVKHPDSSTSLYCIPCLYAYSESFFVVNF